MINGTTGQYQTMTYTYSFMRQNKNKTTIMISDYLDGYIFYKIFALGGLCKLMAPVCAFLTHCWLQNYNRPIVPKQQSFAQINLLCVHTQLQKLCIGIYERSS